MPRSFGSAPKQSATDIAAALMSEDVAPDTAAPEVEPEVQPEAQPQPERGPRRDQSGRFAPREASVPTEPTEQPAPARDTSTPAPAQEEIDYRAELERQRQENERLRRTYENNTRQQREALEEARREAEALRAAKKAERDQLLADARAEVNAMPDGPERWQAERQLAVAERQEAERIRAEIDAERQQQEQADRQQRATQADQMVRTAAWDSLEQWAIRRGRELKLTAQQAEAALNTLKTDDVARLFRELSPQSLIDHTRTVLGNRLDGELVRQRTLADEQAKEQTEANRQEAIASGAHGHVTIPSQATPNAPYVAYTRENKTMRLGRKAATEAILAGVLDE